MGAHRQPDFAVRPNLRLSKSCLARGGEEGGERGCSSNLPCADRNKHTPNAKVKQHNRDVREGNNELGFAVHLEASIVSQ